MKLIYLGNFKDHHFEGMIKVLKELTSFFNKKYQLVINPQIKTSGLINIHSAGIYEAIKYYKAPNKKIYSLHSNITNTPFKFIKDKLLMFKHLHSSKKEKDLAKKVNQTVFGTLSHMIPIKLKREILKKMDLVICPNEITRKKINLKNSITIHHGIDTKKFKKIKTLARKILTVSYFGHPAPSKGVLDVVRAFKLLKGRYIKKIYLSQTNDKIKKFIEKEDKKIKIKGYIQKINEEYCKSDIIVLPYLHEAGAIATPLVLLEAMACERAIITTNLPHLKEICGDSVIYVPPKTPKKIIEKIKLLSENKNLRKTLGKRARKRILKYYTLEEMLDKYDKVYQSFKEKVD